MAWQRRLDGGLSPRRARFDPGPFRGRFLVHKVEVGQIFHCQQHFTPMFYAHCVYHNSKNYEKDERDKAEKFRSSGNTGRKSIFIFSFFFCSFAKLR